MTTCRNSQLRLRLGVVEAYRLDRYDNLLLAEAFSLSKL